jgi:hypothetical protein
MQKDGHITIGESRQETLFPGELRDWFAGQAVTGLLSEFTCFGYEDVADVAWDAYKVADAMLAASREDNHADKTT